MQNLHVFIPLVRMRVINLLLCILGKHLKEQTFENTVRELRIDYVRVNRVQM